MAADGGWFRTRLAEAVAIILSILIAFGIDAGWDEWQERQEEADLLTALRSEYESNRALVQEVIDLHAGHMEDMETVSRLTPADYDTMSVITASRLVLALANPWTYNPELGTTETLFSSGRIALIRDRELAEMLTTFVNFVEDAEEDADFIREGSEYVWRQQYRHGGPWFNAEVERSSKGTLSRLESISAAGPEDLRRVWADSLVRGGGRMNQINVAYYLVELERIRDQVERILDRLADS
ncbi:MAG: hypothetical protein R3314_00365 [Longimicrobiales bacterium]|nr:hypothetical protein [Longimicrobiales bacterium]